MIAGHKGEIPFIVLLLPFLAGITAGIYIPATGWLLLLKIILYVSSAAFLLLNLSYKTLKLYRQKWLGGSLIHLLLFLLGWITLITYNELNNKNHFSTQRAEYLLIKIAGEPKVNGDQVRFPTAVEESLLNNKKTSVSGTLLLTIKDSTASNLYYGDELLIPANFRPIDPPHNPGEFNYKKYLANQNIYYQAYLYHGQYVLLRKNTGNPIISYSLRLRQYLVERFKHDIPDKEAAAVASTLILGYKADLSNDVLQAYSKTGTIHVLSVSGAHVAIIFWILNLLLGFMDRFKHGKVIRAVSIIILIWFYSMLTGFSPAVCRAAVMISMIILGKTYSRHINTLNILAISAFFLLLYNPLFIVDVGFQLSYLAVFGLIAFQPVVYKWLDIENKWIDKLWLACSASIAAQLITFPLSAWYFHQFPVYFLFSNLFIIVPSFIIMATGLGYLVLGWIPLIGIPLGFVLEQTILFMNKVLAWIEHAPYSAISKIWLTSVEYLLFYGVIIWAFSYLHYKRSSFLKMALAFLLLIAVSISVKRYNNLNTTGITFLDLKKHTGIVFKNGDDAIVLTDLCDTDKIYKYSIQPFLDSSQVNHTRILSINSDMRNNIFQKKNNLIQFNNKLILLYNNKFCGAILPEKLKVDYLYVTTDWHADLDLINNNLDYNVLVIAGNNSNTLITKLQEEAIARHINYIIPGRNKSDSLISN